MARNEERADAAGTTQATVFKARDAMTDAIAARAPYDRQLELADAYIAAIKAHGKATGRRLPVPNRYAVLRQLG